jgi:hypothetical protein
MSQKWDAFLAKLREETTRLKGPALSNSVAAIVCETRAARRRHASA